jgi:molybdopterin synthase sulfur carrier subunit
MSINIMLFGRLADLAGTSQLTMSGVPDTDKLIAILKDSYPGLASSSYSVAVNKQLVSGNTVLADNSTVALLPPFSGG